MSMGEQCHECGHMVMGNKSMEHHVEIKLKDTKTCPVCAHNFFQTSELVRHFASTHVTRFCSACEGLIHPKDTLVEHVLAMHKPNSHLSSSFECKECNQRFASLKSRDSHHLSHHQVQVCKYCSQRPTFAGILTFRKHLRLEHSLGDVDKHPPFLPGWGKVNKATATEEDAEDIKQPTVMLTRLEELFKCPLCKYSASQRANLLRHYESIHFRFACHVCDAKLKGRKEAGEHQRREHPRAHEPLLTPHPEDIVALDVIRIQPKTLCSRERYQCMKADCDFSTLRISDWIKHKCVDQNDNCLESVQDSDTDSVPDPATPFRSEINVRKLISLEREKRLDLNAQVAANFAPNPNEEDPDLWDKCFDQALDKFNLLQAEPKVVVSQQPQLFIAPSQEIELNIQK